MIYDAVEIAGSGKRVNGNPGGAVVITLNSGRKNNVCFYFKKVVYYQ
jgi:hypothetical protein